MSIEDDRAALTFALAEHIPEQLGRTITVSRNPPAKLTGYMVYLTMNKVEPAGNFGRDLKVTWLVTGTVPATNSIREATAELDALTDAILAAVQKSDAADLVEVYEYVGLLEPTNGATYPAVQITLESITDTSTI